MQSRMIVHGEEVEGISGKRIDVINPANEEIVGSVPAGGPEDADRALKSAERAFQEWKKVPVGQRADLLLKLAEGVTRERERLGKMLCLEHGKPYREALGEVGGCVSFLETAAQGARRIEGDIVPSDLPGEQIWIQKVPYGVTVGLTAMNFPLAQAGRKMGFALAAGNVMVIKPPSDVPLTVVEFAKIALEVGIPPGVFNVVTGTGSKLGSSLVQHRSTRLVSHTGSTAAGQQIIRDSAEWVTDLILELGGKAPFIVMEDADIERAVDAAVTSRFSNCGQVCTCNERMYLHANIYDKFMDKFLSRVKAITIGDQLSNPDIGPMVTRSAVERVEGLVRDAKEGGATVEVGGARPTGDAFKKGFWFQPTVLTGVKQEMRVVQEEIFGPMVPVMSFRSFDEVLAYANDCQYGLAAYLWTADLKRVMRTVGELDFGEIYINRGIWEQFHAYHSGMKKSGLAGEDGKYGLDNYLHKKTQYVNFS